MESNPIKIPGNFDARAFYAESLKNLKSSLPKVCTFLSSYRTSKGEDLILAKINGNSYYFTPPPNFIFRLADLEELKSQIIEKCNSDVSE